MTMRVVFVLALLLLSATALAQSTNAVDSTRLNGYAVLTPPADQGAAPRLNGYAVLTPPPDKIAGVKAVSYAVLVQQYPHVTIMGE